MSSSHRPIWSMTLHFYERNEKFMKKRLIFSHKKDLLRAWSYEQDYGNTLSAGIRTCRIKGKLSVGV